MKISPRGRALTLWLPLGLVKLLFLIAAILVGQVASAQDRWPRELNDYRLKPVGCLARKRALRLKPS